MRKSLTIGALVLSGLLAHSAARADITLFFDPTPSNVGIGDVFSVDIKSTLQPSGPGIVDDIVSAFDFNIDFDSAILAAQSVAFGNSLDGGFGFSLQFSDLSVLGTAQVQEVSFLSDATLAASQQPGPITLVTLEFEALSAGSSALDIMFNGIQDVKGRSNTILTVLTPDGTVNVAPAVPVPATVALLLLGLSGIWGASKRRLSLG